MQMIIDSGATCNIIDQNLWEHLKLENIRCESTKASQMSIHMAVSNPYLFWGNLQQMSLWEKPV
jgi:hypothetical protein